MKKLLPLLFLLFLYAITLVLFAALPATDNFNRSDETPMAGNWTMELNSLNLVSNAAFGVTNNQINLARWNADAFPDDQYSQVVLIGHSGGSLLGPWGRVANGAVTGYTCLTQISADGEELIYLQRYDAGTFNDLANASSTALTSGGTLRIEVTGSNPVHIDCLENGVSVVDFDDSSGNRIASGSAGIGGYVTGANTNSMDNWEGGSLGGGSPPSRRRIVVIQ